MLIKGLKGKCLFTSGFRTSDWAVRVFCMCDWQIGNRHTHGHERKHIRRRGKKIKNLIQDFFHVHFNNTQLNLGRS